MKARLLLGALALWSAAAFAVPTSDAVKAAVNAGNFAQAETMMREVVEAKPKSAKAHYLYAEILAHNAKFDDAARQATLAREADPTLGFTDPDKFRAFEKTLQREQAGGGITTGINAGTGAQVAPSRVSPPVAVAPYRQPVASGGVPGWVWGLGFAVIAFIVWRAVSRRQVEVMAPAGGYGGAGYAPQGGGFGPQGGGYGMAPMQPGYGPGYGPAPGGGLLRTGLAAAGGVAAGMLVEKMIDGNRREDEYRDDRSGLTGGAPASFDNGSSQAASELENRPIDFGTGNDWGGDASPPASDDFTPSGDDGGGW